MRQKSGRSEKSGGGPNGSGPGATNVPAAITSATETVVCAGTLKASSAHAAIAGMARSIDAVDRVDRVDRVDGVDKTSESTPPAASS